MRYAFVVCVLCLPVIFIYWIQGANPYNRWLEDKLLRHRRLYQAWLTARNVAEIAGEKEMFVVDGQATAPECRHGCRVDSVQVYRSEGDEWVAIRWLRDKKLCRVLVASRCSNGRHSARLFLERNKGLLAAQVPGDGRVALYDVDYWLTSGKLRTGMWLSGSLDTTSVVLQSSIVGEGTGGVPEHFWCYWEIGEDGQVLARGMYGS